MFLITARRYGTVWYGGVRRSGHGPQFVATTAHTDTVRSPVSPRRGSLERKLALPRHATRRGVTPALLHVVMSPYRRWLLQFTCLTTPRVGSKYPQTQVKHSLTERIDFNDGDYWSSCILLLLRDETWIRIEENLFCVKLLSSWDFISMSIKATKEQRLGFVSCDRERFTNKQNIIRNRT